MLNLHEKAVYDWNTVLFVGMGNRIRSDDGIGIYIAEKIKLFRSKNVIIAENSIENYIGKINAHPSDCVVIIDAVDQGKQAGYYALLPITEIKNTTANTHVISLDTISSFLTASLQWVLAIQPKDVSIGFKISTSLKKTGDRVADEIISKISKQLKPIAL